MFYGDQQISPRCLDKQDRTQASDLVSFTETDGILVKKLVVDLFLEEVEVCGSSEIIKTSFTQLRMECLFIL